MAASTASISAYASEDLSGAEWALSNSGGTVCSMEGKCQSGVAGADIKATAAWKISRDCSNALIAVIDSGADSTHPDIRDNITGGKNFTTATPSADFTDDNAHGTHVTGTIAGNGAIEGICQTAKVLEVKVADAQGRLADSDILAGIDYAVSQGAKVVNASFGGPGKSAATSKAIKKAKNTLFVVAAGNDGSDNDSVPTYPASYGLANIVVVAASDNKDEVTDFSNFGKSVDLAAPGFGILSTTPLEATDFMTSYKIPAGHAVFDGTSMATPHVTGAAALYLSNNAGATVAVAKAKLLSSVDVIDSMAGKVRSGGRLNLLALMQ
ncbi:MAG: S8 family serine peptidase [Bdellovibrionota bacterium]